MDENNIGEVSLKCTGKEAGLDTRVWNFSSLEDGVVFYRKIRVLIKPDNEVFVQFVVTANGSQTDLGPGHGIGPHVSLRLRDRDGIEFYSTGRIGEIIWRCDTKDELRQFQTKVAEAYTRTETPSLSIGAHRYRRC